MKTLIRVLAGAAITLTAAAALAQEFPIKGKPIRVLTAGENLMSQVL